MKLFALVLYMCSGVANTCLQPFVFEEKFNSAYDCMIKGYEEGKNKIIEIGPEDVNKNDIKNEIISLCYKEKEYDKIKDFLLTCDKHQNINFKDVNPEIWELLNEYLEELK